MHARIRGKDGMHTVSTVRARDHFHHPIKLTFNTTKPTIMLRYLALCWGLCWAIGLQAQEQPALLFSLERTTCYGNCPYYSVEIYANGTARYHGKRHVERLGLYRAAVPRTMVQQLKERTQAIGYQQMHPKYPVEGLGIIDLPLCITTVVQDGEAKTIYNRNDAPMELVTYEQLLDDLVETLDWQPANPTKN